MATQEHVKESNPNILQSLLTLCTWWNIIDYISQVILPKNVPTYVVFCWRHYIDSTFMLLTFHPSSTCQTWAQARALLHTQSNKRLKISEHKTINEDITLTQDLEKNVLLTFSEKYQKTKDQLASHCALQVTNSTEEDVSFNQPTRQRWVWTRCDALMSESPTESWETQRL